VRRGQSLFRAADRAEDVVWSYAGVRPLFDDASGSASAVTRDYVFDVEGGDGTPPSSRSSAARSRPIESSRARDERLAPLLGCPRKGWTATTSLPGGDLPNADFSTFRDGFSAAHPMVPGRLRPVWRALMVPERS
jgi:glycerol-3-phosphate dehydrogenase